MVNLFTRMILFLIIRLVLCVLVQTYYVPDEYFQGIEVAHRIVFGYGAPLTWEWNNSVRIRGALFPLVLSVPYSVVKILRLDSFPLVVQWAPRIWTAFLASFGDVSLYNLVRRSSKSPAIAWFSMLCVYTNWYYSFVITRTLSNSLEVVVLLIALNCLLEWRQKWNTSSLLVAVSILIRPTAALFWVSFCIPYIKELIMHKWVFIRFLFQTIALTTFLSILLDSLFYGQFTFIPWNFFKVNVIQSKASAFGTHPPHWYLLASLAMLGPQIVPAIAGTFVSNNHKPLFTATLLILCYSAIPHKEMRFILPTIPIFLVYSAHMFNWLYNRKSKRYFYSMTVFTITPHILAFLYFGLIHQSAPIQAARYISKQNLSNSSVHVLTNCHSMPSYSFVHQNLTLTHLTCEDTIAFTKSPRKFLSEFYFKNSLPQYLVMFNSKLQYLPSDDYEIVASFRHYSFEAEGSILLVLKSSGALKHIPERRRGL